MKRATTAGKGGTHSGCKSIANCRQEEQCQQAPPTKRAEDDDAGVQDNGVTHTRNYVHKVENEINFLTAEAPEKSTVSSSTHVSTEHCGDSTGTALERGSDQSL